MTSPALPEPIWYEDVSVLLLSSNVLSLLPSENQTREENANSVMRFALCFGIASALARKSFFPLAVVLFVAPATFFWYTSVPGSFAGEGGASPGEDGDGGKSRSRKRVVKPTRQNPFMNSFEPDEKNTYFADPLDPGVSKAIDDEFYGGGMRDSDDLYHRNASSRQFYTVPAPRSPNEQGALANWLYGGVRAGGKFTRPPSNAVY